MNLRKQVTEILKLQPETRNSDITLMIALWERYYPQRIRDGAVLLSSLYDLPREDSIKRLRADLNSKGRYLPTSPEVLKQRGIEEDRWREELGYGPKSIKLSSDNEFHPRTLI